MTATGILIVTIFGALVIGYGIGLRDAVNSIKLPKDEEETI